MSREHTLSRVIVGLAALWIGFAGLQWGTWSAGSADAHGYISQAALWLQGHLVVPQPMATSVSWENAGWVFTPLGYRPGVEAGTFAPIYAVGLPLVMAGLQAIGGPQAVYLAVPLFGVAAVLASARLATRVASPAAGAVAALCLASSPSFLFSLMWPMSDVPASALWALALVLAAGASVASAYGAGLAIALAVLTRPNLVLLALAPAVFLLWRVKSASPPEGRRPAWTRLAIVYGLTAAGCLGVAAVHTWFYGSPLSTGYGHVSQVYSVSNLPAAATGFVLRPLDVEPPLVVLGVVGLLWHLRRARGEDRAVGAMAAGAAGLVLASYAFYVSFSEWWYLRLLLPAWPVTAAFAGVAIVGLARRAPRRWHAATAAALSAVVIGGGMREAFVRGVFVLRDSESRYETVARFARRGLPENAIFFAYQESGSLRYYADRPIVRFDWLPPQSFNDAIETLRARGYHPYFVVEDHEETLFHERFQPVSPLAQLDWPPVAELNGPVRVRIFDPAHRDWTRDGGFITTFRLEP